MNAVKIHIKDDIYTIVDSDIAEKLKGKSIFLRSKNAGYACFKQKGKKVTLHRFVLKAKSGQICDHINRNKLDNRRCNLRFINVSQNALNSNIKAKGKSKFLRVSRHSKSWRVRIRVKGRKKSIACFSSKTVAAIFADNARKKYSSVTPRLNFQSRLKRSHLPNVLSRTKGRIFSVVFVRRKDGSERHMVCRLNVSKNVNGKGLLFAPEQINLLPVYDIKKKDYRFIPIENVLCLTFRKKRYRVTN